MTNERWLRWAIARHFREQGYKVTMRSIKVGNASIGGEVVLEKASAGAFQSARKKYFSI